MKKKLTALIGVVVCFMMMATLAWSAGIPGVPNGTVTDGNLVWLQNANCFGKQNWSQATSSAANLKSASCGLTDGSTAGQWRLPTKEELVSRRKKQGFNSVQASYWSSSSYDPKGIRYAWFVNMYDYYMDGRGKESSFYVWPVRSGQ